MTQSTLSLPKAVYGDVWRAGLVVVAFFVFAGLWAGLAPIAKTIRISGEISPQTPSRTVQHPTGGRIQSIHVALYDRVQKGDLLLTFDQAELTLKQKTLQARAGLLREELAHLESRLSDSPLPAGTADPLSPITRMFEERDQVLAARLQTGLTQIEAAEENLILLTVSRDILQGKRAQVAERLEKSEHLSKKGFLAQTKVEQTAEAVLQIDVELSRQDMQIEAAKADIAASRAQAGLIKSEYMTSLAEQRSNSQRELISIDGELERITHVLQKSAVHATADGMITSLPFETEDMVATSGATLAVISLPLEDPEIELWIPPRHIDQTRPNQEGQLTITSLPARDAPKLTITVTSVAEEPVKDREGKIVHYLARATISAEDIEVARAQMAERFQLIQGMPVSVALSIDSVTLGEFLTQPLWSIWKTAFEE